MLPAIANDGLSRLEHVAQAHLGRRDAKARFPSRRPSGKWFDMIGTRFGGGISTVMNRT